MLHRAQVLIIGLLIVCAGLIVVLRAAGQTTTPSPVYLDTGDCDQPCWQGIRPGESTRAEFAQQVAAISLFSAPTPQPDQADDIAYRLDLVVMGEITIADLIREFGPPDRVSCLSWTHTTRYPGQNLALLVRLYFAGGLIEAEAIRPGDIMRLSPDMQVRLLSYFPPGEPVYPIGETTTWHGFASIDVYPRCR